MWSFLPCLCRSIPRTLHNSSISLQAHRAGVCCLRALPSRLTALVLYAPVLLDLWISGSRMTAATALLWHVCAAPDAEGVDSEDAKWEQSSVSRSGLLRSRSRGAQCGVEVTTNSYYRSTKGARQDCRTSLLRSTVSMRTIHPVWHHPSSRPCPCPVHLVRIRIRTPRALRIVPSHLPRLHPFSSPYVVRRPPARPPASFSIHPS
ncbi:hypothetical protein FB451DRAFT_1238248 [Mycena latifolia]|nr:hypothetical protein FB451DRAFT_1238248 [Mycena latifolia]